MDCVKRYIWGAEKDTLWQDPEGGWVRYPDYAALQARVAELESLTRGQSEQIEKQGNTIIRINSRAEAAEARVAELEAAVQEAALLAKLADAEAAEALLSEAVKAGMLEAQQQAANLAVRLINGFEEMTDIEACQTVGRDIRAHARNHETITRIVSQVKEGRR